MELIKKRIHASTKVIVSIVSIIICLSCNNNEADIKAEAASKLKDNALLIDSPLTIYSSYNKILNFYYIDSFYYGHQIVIKKGGNQISIKSPLLLLQADNNQTPFLLHPGEKIRLIQDSSNGVLFTIEGNKMRSNELKFYKQLLMKTSIMREGFEFLAFQKSVNNIAEVFESEHIIEENKHKRIAFLKQYSDTAELSEAFKSTVLNTIVCTDLKDRLILYYNNATILKKEKKYYDKIDSCFMRINQDSFLIDFSFLNLCKIALGIGLEKKYFKDFKADNPNDFILAMDYTNSHFKNLPKDFLLSRCMYDAIEKGVPISAKYLALYNQSCSNEWYKKAISKKMADVSTLKLTAGRDLLLSINDSTKEFDQIISSYKHKLILIDFWASWCMPCREEMPSSEKLKNLYKDKNIVFIYISIDKNVEAWRHAAKEEGLNDAANFLFLNPDNSPFCKQYNITTIPRYMLLGKDGKIINADSPRPSTPELKLLIEKYLQQ